MDRWEMKGAVGSSEEERGRRKDNWRGGRARENDETQRGSGQGWMGGVGWGNGRGRQVSECIR